MGCGSVCPLPFLGLCCFLVACTPLRGPAPIEERASGSAGPWVGDEVLEPASAPQPATGVAATEQSGVAAETSTSARTMPVQFLLASAMQASARNDWAVAAATLERAIKLAPTDGGLWTQLAYVHYRRGDLTQARQLGRRALTRSFTSSARAATWRLLEKVEWGAGDAPAARAAAEQALRLE